MNRIEIPEWLYRCWPWLVLALWIGYTALPLWIGHATFGIALVALPLSAYTAWLFTIRYWR